ncbi:MAG: proline--tRNA ligase [Thermoplasmatota archaeon]
MGKADDFSAWYNDVIEKADLIDKRYPVKGMDVWRPYGLSIMRSIDDFTRKEMRRTKHDEVQFPLLIPQTEFQKEADQIKGFGGEVYWVTQGGESPLDIPLVVRPTSETAMYPMFALWVRSHKDLPLKIFQIVSAFRYETKQTRSFMRVREIHFFEAHTAHVDFEDAERQIKEEMDVWAAIADTLCLPYTLSKRPDWDKFPGAFYTTAADTLLPGNAPGEWRTLQIATIHHYRDNFARAYGIAYENGAGEHVHAHQTTYGMSERLLGAIVAVHGDEKGLRLPPAIAPIQGVIVPILFKGKEAPVLKACEELRASFEKAGLRVHVDLREETAGFKFNDWEMRGVPVRIEVGPRDVEKQQFVLVRRDDGSKHTVPMDAAVAQLHAALEAYGAGLKSAARAKMDDAMHTIKAAEDARNTSGILRVGWCGAEACGKLLQDKSQISVLGFPVEVAFPQFGLQATELLILEKDQAATCAVCGKPGHFVRLAKTY